MEFEKNYASKKPADAGLNYLATASSATNMIKREAASDQEKVSNSKSWCLSFVGKAGSSRHPSSRRQTIEVLEDLLHVKKAIYEPDSTIKGYSAADIYVSINGGIETHVYMLDTKLPHSEVDLGSVDHLLFEKGSKVRFRVAFKGSVGGKVELHGESTNMAKQVWQTAWQHDETTNLCTKAYEIMKENMKEKVDSKKLSNNGNDKECPNVEKQL